MGFGGVKGFGDDDPDDDHDDLPLDDDARGRSGSSLPDPLDRIWLHPSELSPLAAATVTRPKPMWTTTLVAGAAGAILTLAVLGAVGAIGGSSDNDQRTAVPTSVPIVTAQTLAFAVAHSVVAVSARGDEGMRRGSGVCVNHSGEILTSNRLVGDATSVHVTTADGKVHEAQVVGRDATTDLVLLSVSPDASGQSNPASAKLGVPVKSAGHASRAGDTVWVVGAPSPGDSSLWMSSGLVASIDSKVAIEAGPTTSGLLETAAPSSAASAGGALVDRAGDVTGIILSPIPDSRVTYAVPIAAALAVADDLREQGFTAHGSLGVNGVNSPAGPRVTEVLADGPAEAAGVRVDDVLQSVDNHEIDTTNDLMALVRHYKPGQSVVLGVRRGTKSIRVSATLGSMVTP